MCQFFRYPTDRIEAFRNLSIIWDEFLVGVSVIEDVEVGDYAFRSGDRAYDLILVDTAQIDVVRDSLWWIGNRNG